MMVCRFVSFFQLFTTGSQLIGSQLILGMPGEKLRGSLEEELHKGCCLAQGGQWAGKDRLRRAPEHHGSTAETTSASTALSPRGGEQRQLQRSASTAGATETRLWDD